MSEATKPCPYCAEPIQEAAKKCRFCGEYLEENLRNEAKKEKEKPQVVKHKSGGLVTFLVVLGIIALLAFLIGF
jgi:hypothetical protein